MPMNWRKKLPKRKPGKRSRRKPAPLMIRQQKTDRDCILIPGHFPDARIKSNVLLPGPQEKCGSA